MRNWIGKFIHNCIAHPLTCFLPKDMGDRFHDWTIEKFWGPEEEFDIEISDDEAENILTVQAAIDHINSNTD